MELNKQQLEAINYFDSPLLIVAGPGTGKTKVLTEKIILLIEKKGFDPNRILVSTFTNKGADELKNRLRKKLGDKVETMQISTIHSFCQKMLETFPEYHNLGNIFKVLDDLDQFIYVNKNYWNYGLKDYIKDIDVNELINFYNKCTENNVDPKSLVKELKHKSSSNLDLAIANSYQIYLANLLNPNDTKLDFALLQRELYLRLYDNKEFLSKVRDLYDYILIDEYQDTNPIQDAIFKLLAEPKYNITVVGDEDQSIYGFRGASIKNFRTFLERYPKAKKLELEENFRSHAEIVNMFDDFIKPYRTFEKKVFTKNKNFTKPILIKSKTFEDEGKELVNFVKKIILKNNVEYKDITILFKSVKNHSSFIVEELEKEKIPFITYGDSSLLYQDEIRDFLVLFMYINSYEPNDFQKEWLFTTNILESELLDLKQDTYSKLVNEVNIYNLLESYDFDKLKKLGINKDDIELLINLKNLKKNIERKKISLLKQFYKLLNITLFHKKLFKKYETGNDPDSEIKIKNIANFSKLITKFEENTNSKEFKTFLFHISSIPENKMEDSASFDEVNAIKLMTIHQAKGLEFPIVILAGVTSRRYNTDSKKGNFLIDIPKELMLDKEKFDRGAEVRRTFYVGMSRAKKILTISIIDGKGNKPSKFVDEIGQNNFTSYQEFNGSFLEDEHYVPIKEKSKISYSSVSAYSDCPFRFYMRDLLEFQTPMDYYQTYGVIVHNALKKIHVMMKNNENVDIHEIVKVVDLYCKDDESRQKWRDELITDLWNYYEQTSNFIKEVVDVELPFSYINADVIVNGQVDLIIKNKKDELEIIDYKSRYKEGLKNMSVDLQLRMYSLALEGKYNEKINNISAYTFKDNQKTNYIINDTELEETKKIIKEISDSIDSKKFNRNWQSSKFCENKTGKCEFYYLCKGLEEDKNNGK